MNRHIRIKAILGSAVAATLVLAASFSQAATLKAGTCRGVSTPNGYKYVGTYCVDFQCTVVQTLMFDSFCPYSVD